MEHRHKYTQELYIAFQVCILVLLLNSAFPLSGKTGSLGMKLLAVGYFVLVLFFVVEKVRKEVFKEGFHKNWERLGNVLEGLFFLGFLSLFEVPAGMLSNFIFIYVLMQSIRYPEIKRKLFVYAFAAGALGYIYFLGNGGAGDDAWLLFLGDIGFVAFIVLCMSIVFRQINDLQNEKEYFIHALIDSNNKLSEMANTDFLTGLNNHKSFYLAMRNFGEGQGRPLSMALVDIDNFKQINDQYGHVAGDHILAQLSTLMKQAVRESDFVARYGGEEFAIIFPSMTLDKARKTCERLRKAVEQHAFDADGNTLQVTVSTGVCYLEALEEDIIQDFIKQVDVLLYKAKDQGKNQVVAEVYQCYQ